MINFIIQLCMDNSHERRIENTNANASERGQNGAELRRKISCKQ